MAGWQLGRGRGARRRSGPLVSRERPRPGRGARLRRLPRRGRPGNLGHARALAARGRQAAEAQRDWAYAAQCRWVLGQAELSADDPAAALHWLEPIADMIKRAASASPAATRSPPT